MLQANPKYHGLTWPVILPIFEVARSRIPYYIWVLLFYAPIGFAAGCLNSLMRMRHGGPIWVMPALCVGTVTAIAMLLGVLHITGLVSGYRPFWHRWEYVPMGQAAQQIERIAQCAGQVGFEIVWCKQGTGFVAVRDTQMEDSLRPHNGQSFPIRLSLFVRDADPAYVELVMKLENRTVVFWDTGERQTLMNVGVLIIHRSADPLPAPSPVAKLPLDA